MTLRMLHLNILYIVFDTDQPERAVFGAASVGAPTGSTFRSYKAPVLRLVRRRRGYSDMF